MNCGGINCPTFHSSFAGAQACTYGHAFHETNQMFEKANAGKELPPNTCPHGLSVIGGPKEGCPACNALREERDRRAVRIVALESRRPTLISDCEWKLREGDWHGVQDCASDLRDLDAELKGLRA